MAESARASHRPYILAGVLVLFLSTGVFLLRTASGRHWVGDALVSIVDAWLVPEVTLGGFTLESPTTARLDDLRLIGPDDRPILEIAHLTVTLADVPTEGEPLRIGRLVLDRPILHLRPDPDQLGFVPLGFSPFIEPDPLADPSKVALRLRPSRVLELRHLEIKGGEIIIEDGSEAVLEVDGIGLVLTADPAATPAGTPGHHAHAVFGHPPGVVLELDALIDLDTMVVWLEQGELAVELSEPDLVEKLSPKMQTIIETHQLKGHIEGELTGRLDLRNPAASKAQLQLSLNDLHGAAGAWRLPVDEGHLDLVLENGLAHISEASAQLLGGSLALRQADLAMAEANVALAGDIFIQDIHLHQLLRHGADDPARQSVANGTGRLFLASEEMSFGLTLADFALGPPGASPVVSFRAAQVRDLQPHASGIPLTIEGFDLDGLLVDLQLTDNGLRGLPIPPPAAAADPTDAGSEVRGPHWSERFLVRELTLTDSAVQIAPAGAPPWRLPQISGTLEDLGGSTDNLLRAVLDVGVATVRASGTLDLKQPQLNFQKWSIQGDLQAPATRSLLPPDLRPTVVALVPSGTVQGSGRARFPLGGGTPSVELDLTLTEGSVALPGLRMPVDSGRADLSVERGSVRVANGELEGAGGSLSLPAVVLDANDQLTLSARAQRLRLDRLRTDAGAKLGMGRLSGQVSAAIQFVSHAQGTAIGGLSLSDATVSIDGDPLGTLTWTDVDLAMTPRGEQLGVTGSAAAGDGARATFQGHMPIGGDHIDIDQFQIDLNLSDTSGRSALPPSIQVAIADIRAGQLSVVGDGVVSLADPMRSSTAAMTLQLEDGAWDQAGYRFGGLSGTAPLSLADARLTTSGAAISGLGGRFGVTEGWWSIPDDRGHLRWKLTGLNLTQLGVIEGSPNALEGTLKGKGTLDLMVTANDGLTVPAGRGSLHVRDGKLLSLPALAPLIREEDKTGDDAMNVRFQLDQRAATLNSIVIDLGPVRYIGAGEIRWTGALDVHLEASPRPGERATIVDLAARLVAWNIRGTLEEPHAQALPLGIDTRTFDQMAQDPRDMFDEDALPADSVLREDEQSLDELPEAGATVAPPPPDRTEFGNMDELDDLDDF